MNLAIKMPNFDLINLLEAIVKMRWILNFSLTLMSGQIQSVSDEIL